MKIAKITGHSRFKKKTQFYFIGLNFLTIVVGILTLLYIIAYNGSNDFIILANSGLPIVLLVTLLGVTIFRIKKEKILFWCPLTWFCLGAALAFGYGSSIWYFADQDAIDEARRLYDATDRQILGTNILNSLSILFILSGYWLGIKWFSSGKSIIATEEFNVFSNIRNIKRLLTILLPIYIPYELFIQLPTLYGLSSFTLPGFLNTLSKLGDVIVLLMFYLWGKGIKRYAYYGTFICLLIFISAIPSFGKASMLAPFLAATLGYYWATLNIKVFFYGAALIFALFTIVSPISVIGRVSTFGVNEEKVSAAMVSDVLLKVVDEKFGDTANTYEEKKNDTFWKRNSFNNVQSYLMEAYDNGMPGTSLNAFFIALIPRVVWPDKPINSVDGLALDAMVKGLADSKSQLAPTFNGEAYWNGGWGMVGLVSILIGMQFARFATSAHRYLSKGDIRYFFIALMGIQFGLTVESWIIAKYVGGYVIILCLWLIIKWSVPWKEDNTSKKKFSI